MRIEFEDPRLFEQGRKVRLSLDRDEKDASIEWVRFQHGRWILKLDCLGSISEAERWVGAQVLIRPEEIPEPESGTYFDFDLTGCEVYDRDQRVGVVTGVMDYGSTPLLQIDRNGSEVLVPFARQFMKAIDTAARRIDVELPEGLLELNS